MRRAVTFAITGSTSELVSGPEVPLPAQLRSFKDAIRAGSFADADSLEVWISGGGIKTAKFKKRPAASDSTPEKLTRKKTENESAK
jgi:hypothetical protein